jgi:hypothetical protein
MADTYQVAGGDDLTIANPTPPKLTTKGLVSADQFFLETVELITPVNNVNIKSLVVELSYYEDILKGSVTGHLLLSDSISMIERLGLSGGDFLNLSFSKSRGDKDTKSIIKKYFRIYRVSERILNNSETENYTLHFCSEELFLSEQSKISKPYSGQKISDIVYDILNNHLKIDDKYISLQETDGLYDFVIPYKKPFEAINWLATYAIQKNKAGADFLFFENSGGFNFISLQNMFNQTAYNTYAFSQKNAGDSPELVGELGRGIYGIKSYTFLDTFDSLYGITSGAFANRLISVDPLTRRYKDTKFDYIKDYLNKVDDLNGSPIMNDLKNRFGKTQNQNYDGVLKVMTSNAGQKFAQGISDTPFAVGGDIRAETYVPYRTAQIALSHYSRIKLTLAGDPNLTVGRTILVKLPSSVSNNDGSGYNEGNPDPFNSGKYLIAAVRHIITTEMKYETVVEVVKDSFASPLTNYTSSVKLTDAINGKR